ncbi:hypothetical protein [Bifidobacterium sp. ESL0745]|uniref:hypothetical protein n=1 Tax=Bifidobacterium sp. ESL0745 TaxID=2983226 RepID=UPI0023F78715|nr:hypothetical protein [Bifidobacterium sp. ESL0745]MDF7664877.1 hypothetical protein [Bifidobacterium sp. ESL0745]
MPGNNISAAVSKCDVQRNRIGMCRFTAVLAVMACVLTILSGCGSFSIIGTWKNNGPDSWSSTHSDTITFTEDNCNVYSPKDTYELNKEYGDKQYDYDLEIAGRSGGGVSLGVKVKDNNHIVLSNRATTLNLERIK